MRGLTGKRAIVTGSARGIGRAIAERLLEEGCKVALADVDVAEASVVAAGRDAALVVETDVQDRASIQSMVDQVTQAWGGVDILVSNAGIMDRMPFLEMTDDFWDRVTTLNLKGAFRCGQIVARQMIAQGGGGRIV
ncbi:MAG: SDR family NAD(P)-dependent oxidoreductase, partial [Pseudomonadota bacterium]